MVVSVCKFIGLLLSQLEVKETVVFTEKSFLSEESCSVLEILSHQGVQHVLMEESRSASGDWVHDVIRTGPGSWQPKYIVMMCSVTCVTSALKQASRLEQELGTQSAFGMTSRWLIMTSERNNLLGHLNFTNITMDNVAVFDTQEMPQRSHGRQCRKCSPVIQTLMWAHGSRYWSSVHLAVASHTMNSLPDHPEQVGIAMKEDLDEMTSSADHPEQVVFALKEGLEERLFPNIRHGYNGRRLIVLIKEWMSFAKVCEESGQRVWCGLLLDLLPVVSANLNFTYVVVNATNDQWGTGVKKTANVGFYGRLFRQEADIGLTPTDIILDRTYAMDFSEPLLLTPVVMVYRKPEVTSHLWVLFNPLNVQTIAATLGSLVLVTLLVCGLEMMVEGFRGERLGLEERSSRATRGRSWRNWIVTLDRALQMSGAAFLSEASEVQLRSRPARVLLYTWWLVSMVMAAAYSGTLTAFLSVTKETRLFSSLEDLVTKQHDYKWGTGDYFSIFHSLNTSQNVVHQELVSGMRQFAMEDPDVLSNDLHVLAHKVRSEDFVMFFSKFHADSVFDCDVEVVPLDIKSMQGLVFPKGSALTKPFSRVILQLHASGLLSHWTKKWFPRTSCPPSAPGPLVISMLHVQGVLLLLPLGLGLALGVLAVEVIVVKRWKRKEIEETVNESNEGTDGFRDDLHSQRAKEKVDGRNDGVAPSRPSKIKPEVD